MKKAITIFLSVVTGIFTTLSVSAQIPRNLKQEAANKKLAQDFFYTFYNDKNMDKARKMMHPGFINHHPHSGKGVEETIRAVNKHLFGVHPEFKVFIKRIAAEGDLVWIQCYTQDHPKDHGKMSMDIWRVKDGKIIEHWDIIQDVPKDIEPSSMWD